MKRLWLSGLGLTGLLLGCAEDAAPVEPTFSQNPAAVFINELHYDNAGTDAGEALEIAGAKMLPIPMPMTTRPGSTWPT